MAVIGIGEKFHVVMRRNYNSQIQRHFVGQVEAADGSIVRATGYVFIYDELKAQYIKKNAPRTTVIDLAESGYIVNIIPQTVAIDDLRYEVIDRTYLAFTDGAGFVLDINEYGVKR